MNNRNIFYNFILLITSFVLLNTVESFAMKRQREEDKTSTVSEKRRKEEIDYVLRLDEKNYRIVFSNNIEPLDFSSDIHPELVSLFAEFKMREQMRNQPLTKAADNANIQVKLKENENDDKIKEPNAPNSTGNRKVSFSSYFTKKRNQEEQTKKELADSFCYLLSNDDFETFYKLCEENDISSIEAIKLIKGYSTAKNRYDLCKKILNQMEINNEGN